MTFSNGFSVLQRNANDESLKMNSFFWTASWENKNKKIIQYIIDHSAYFYAFLYGNILLHTGSRLGIRLT